MRKLLTVFAASSSLALFATAAQAECYHGHVTAKAPSEETVAMSTQAGTPPVAIEQQRMTDAAAQPACPGGNDCPPADE